VYYYKNKKRSVTSFKVLGKLRLCSTKATQLAIGKFETDIELYLECFEFQFV